ncbi:hypothetical protein P3T76_007414 [Phytophthora citrophthora]|uniref:Jacalin-type lectin domain-containing protein n=1 Tax=Phytophthora citrophthora TaxID=4793 RepID=A0AAD9GNQ2_9STRA|nr:hypothetical protein P3T76_007414 [Phytophthora citrophthora]
MEVHSAKNGKTNDHTRVFYLKFTTNTGRSVSAGTQTDSSAVATAPEGYQLGGFFGRGDDEIILLGVAWTRIAADLPSTDTVSDKGTARSDDIQLSPIYGGPHDTAFSDITSIKFSRAVSIITICAGARVDGIQLQTGDQTFSHGYSCPQGSTLALGEGEYITSMEVHWGKNRRTNDHTRVFYLKFTTSAGKSVSGGSTTKDNAIATAPDGFQLSWFFGRAGGVIDQLGAIWTRRSSIDLSLTDQMENAGVYAATIRNWVGPTIGQASDTACYRKLVALGSKNACPLGYSNDRDDCLTMCPLSYPVECSLECIPQNDDCALATLTKIGSVVAVALNIASGGVFGDILAAYKAAK